MPEPKSYTPSQRAMRAARGYSGLDAVAWAKELGVSRATIHIYENSKDAPLAILRAAADKIGAPLEFMEKGWPALAAATTAELEARIRALEDRGEG